MSVFGKTVFPKRYSRLKKYILAMYRKIKITVYRKDEKLSELDRDGLTFKENLIDRNFSLDDDER